MGIRGSDTSDTSDTLPVAWLQRDGSTGEDEDATALTGTGYWVSLQWLFVTTSELAWGYKVEGQLPGFGANSCFSPQTDFRGQSEKPAMCSPSGKIPWKDL